MGVESKEDEQKGPGATPPNGGGTIRPKDIMWVGIGKSEQRSWCRPMVDGRLARHMRHIQVLGSGIRV